MMGCKKEKVCWTCEFYPVNGIVHTPIKVCDNNKPKILTDSVGNSLPFNCYK